MIITDKARKLLWGRSGNRCAFCRCELVMDATDTDAEAVVGDECHIVAKTLGGPRGNSNLSNDEINAYSNLILLCKVHHKLVDDQPATHTVELLQGVKRDHEKWVREMLGYKEKLASHTSTNQSSNPDFLIRLLNGTDIFKILSNAYAYDFENDELETQEELDLVSSFLQNAQDWGEILSTMMESGDRTRAGFALTSEIRELEQNGFMVFGNVAKRKFKINNEIIDWPVAIIRVVRNDNSTIINIESSEK